jgi:probable F420-dependent oxidoreductase
MTSPHMTSGPVPCRIRPDRNNFRFGVEASVSPDRASWRALSQEVASLGYSTLVIVDHLDHQFAPVPAMVAAADAAPSLRVGTFVLNSALRHPALLARDIATVDVLTDGRVEFGVGAGWRQTDYQKLGVSFGGATARVAALEETILITKRLLKGEVCTFRGDHFQVVELEGFPTPVQTPHPPILVGGGGKKVLTLAAREADIIGLNPVQAPTTGSVFESATAEATEQKLSYIRSGAGHRFDSIEINVRVNPTLVTPLWRREVERLSRLRNVPVEQVLSSPHVLIGDVPRLVFQLQERRELFGISYVVVLRESFRQFAPIVEALAGT